MAFRVGQKVVCVDDDVNGRYTPWPFRGGIDGLKAGRVYTIRDVGLYCDVPCLWLCGITRAMAKGWERHGEPGYNVLRFRPVVERKTDISIFTAMLTGTKKRRVLAQGEDT